MSWQVGKRSKGRFVVKRTFREKRAARAFCAQLNRLKNVSGFTIRKKP